MKFAAVISVYLVLAAALTGQEANPPTPQSSAQTPSQTFGMEASDVGTTSAPATSEADPSAGGQKVMVLPVENSKDLTEAKRSFNEGVKLKTSGNLDAALGKFEQASSLAPRNAEYLTAREFTRQQLVMQALQKGNQAALERKDVIAMAAFRQALEYDPNNEFAKERLKETSTAAESPDRNIRLVLGSSEINLDPNAGQKDFHFRGDSKQLLNQIAQAYGITTILDDSVQSRRVRFDIEDVNFATAMEAATRVTKTFWVPLSSKQIFFATDTVENRRTFERMSLRTFYIPDAITPQELVELQNALRVLLDIRFVIQNPTESTITIRAPQPMLEAASQLIDDLNKSRPEVLLEMNVYQVASSLMRQLGNDVTTQWTLYNISPALLASLAGGANQNLINQLIASGGINQANSQAIAALLAQLQQATQNPILSTPVATFGGGITFFGVTLGGFTPKLNLNESDIRILQRVTLRASQNNPATMKLGERYPIVNATFAPIYNNAAISRVVGNLSYQAPFPSFTYEDIGLNLKATPMIHTDGAVTIRIELQIRSLAQQSVNGQPVINNREYIGTLTVMDGESGAVAGLIGRDDSRALMGYPFLSQVPGLTYGVSEHDKNVTEDELMIVITPHVINRPESREFAISLPVGH